MNSRRVRDDGGRALKKAKANEPKPKKTQKAPNPPRREEHLRVLKTRQRKFEQYTPLNTSREHVFREMKTEPWFRWPEKLISAPGKRDSMRVCEYHRDHRHNTNECFDLDDLIETHIREGALRRFVDDRDHSCKDNKDKERRSSPSRSQSSRNKALTRVMNIISGGLVAGGTSGNARKDYARHDLS